MNASPRALCEPVTVIVETKALGKLAVSAIVGALDVQFALVTQRRSPDVTFHAVLAAHNSNATRPHEMIYR